MALLSCKLWWGRLKWIRCLEKPCMVLRLLLGEQGLAGHLWERHYFASPISSPLFPLSASASYCCIRNTHKNLRDQNNARVCPSRLGSSGEVLLLQTISLAGPSLPSPCRIQALFRAFWIHFGSRLNRQKLFRGSLSFVNDRRSRVHTQPCKHACNGLGHPIGQSQCPASTGQGRLQQGCMVGSHDPWFNWPSSYSLGSRGGERALPQLG